MDCNKCNFGCRADRVAVFAFLGLACGSHTAATVRRNMAKVKVFIWKIKFPLQYLPSQCDFQIRQFYVICLLPDGPLQLPADEGLAEKAHHMDPAVVDHENVAQESRALGNSRRLLSPCMPSTESTSEVVGPSLLCAINDL